MPDYGGRCPQTGLTRNALDLLTRPQKQNNFKARVESRILKLEGTKRGIRMINHRSLSDYLSSLPLSTGADPEPEPRPTGRRRIRSGEVEA